MKKIISSEFKGLGFWGLRVLTSDKLISDGSMKMNVLTRIAFTSTDFFPLPSFSSKSICSILSNRNWNSFSVQPFFCYHSPTDGSHLNLLGKLDTLSRCLGE